VRKDLLGYMKKSGETEVMRVFEIQMRKIAQKNPQKRLARRVVMCYNWNYV